MTSRKKKRGNADETSLWYLGVSFFFFFFFRVARRREGMTNCKRSLKNDHSKLQSLTLLTTLRICRKKCHSCVCKKLGSCYIWTRYYISSSKCEKEKDLSKGWMLRIPFQGVAMTKMLIYFLRKSVQNWTIFVQTFKQELLKWTQ